MSVRRLSALRGSFRGLFSSLTDPPSLILLCKRRPRSSPKAKVTRSNRVGCAMRPLAKPVFSVAFEQLV